MLWVWLSNVWNEWRAAVRHRQTGDRPRLAPSGFPVLLDLPPAGL